MTDLAVIGAGPAGMAAAAIAAEHGAEVVLLDEQPSPGGQIYRAIAAGGADRAPILGRDYLAGAELAAALDHPRIDHRAGATVWDVEAEGRITYSRAGSAHRIEAERIVLATGALERPVPFPGWTLPGAMTAGGAQILLKSAGIVPRDAVLAGAGPLLYLLAQQLIAAGAPPKALVETPEARGAALRHLPGALRGWRYLAKGRRLLAAIDRAGVPRYRASGGFRAEGDGRVETFEFESGGKSYRLETRTLIVHHGVVPNTQITRALGLEHGWNAQQQCWHPACGADGRTALERILIAGDGAGIGGAESAMHRGRLAAIAALEGLRRLDTARAQALATPERRALARDLAVRPFLDALYPVPQTFRAPPDDATLVCRCEEVTAGEIRGYARLGCLGPNQTKAFGRCGMGPCQGRYCGDTVTALLAEAHGVPEQQIGAFRIRAPIKPVSLGEMAELADSGESL